jgi:spore coat polysaccharide biosynthesis protein SpsF (cytidylyltransferase family)
MRLRVLGILQARTSSSRLPGKVLMPILGRPMLIRQIERLSRCVRLENLVVATSTDPSDDRLAALCRDAGIDCFRGSLDDVLDRFVEAARPYSPDAVVRLTGDCPLADPILIDQIVGRFLDSELDYLSNSEPPTYPDGLDVEVVRFACLQAARCEAVLPSQREHVTPFIRRQPDRFRVANHVREQDLSYLRWTVDEPEDFEFVRRVYEHLYPVDPDFSTDDVLSLLQRNPEIRHVNSRFQRNEGSKKSLIADAAFLAEKKQ